ncbi:MAG: response regulator [Candidatus Omnitrophica bacterium]|nr:response regulator [Candidatus Omnitrophota bacterium]
MENKKILVVDDDAGILKELKEMLELSGYEPLCVNDSREALAIALDANPDLILIDLKMPGINGFQLADKLSQNGFLKNIPVIAMSGYFIEDRQEMLINSCGIDYFLKKPFDSFDVITTIETALAGTVREDVPIGKKRK